MAAELFALVYMSKSTFRFSQSDLTELLMLSRRKNTPAGISGLLLYLDGNFMQLLEGPQETIDPLLERIKKDTRHHDVIVLEAGPIAQRHFSDWSMAFLDFTSLEVRALPGFSTFLVDPFSQDDFTGTVQRHVNLLQYFRAVMMASDSATLRLAEAVEFPATNPAQKEHES